MSVFQESEQQTISNLYRQHHTWLFRWLRGKVESTESAADISHDIFVTLLAREEQLVLTEPRAFLTTLAKRSVANHWRRQQVEKAYLEAITDIPESLQPSEEERAIIVETIVDINRRLQGLPLDVKRAFLYAQLDGMKQQEIAEKLAVSVSTVKRYLTRAAAQCYFAITVK